MDLSEKLTQVGQQHLLRFEKDLTDSQRQQLYQQLADIDFEQVRLVRPSGASRAAAGCEA